jgi:hypothetical protein
MKVGCQRHAPAALLVRRRRGTHYRGGGLGPSAGLFLEKNKGEEKRDSGKEKEKTVKNTDENGMIPV